MARGYKKRNEENGVVITVYVESSAIPSRYNRPIDAGKPKASTKYGNNRRAQLLAHAQRLRRAESIELERPRTKTRSKRKPKKWGWTPSSAKIRGSFRRIFMKRERGYERIVTETINLNKRKSTTWRDSIFCRRLMRMVRGCYGKGENVSSTL
ncbi:uncharacterized protein LOC104882472 [Vitis vinifera]|uniref:uncharacterized protein LOC104882472 n=1 Tax=Vitis vinifera TaxID=29760 RepID=UPI00053F44B7|nr:uncharacterized protein LOC104882472 [Vitis vinifera]|eukprot:XP_010664260.1 PREDICTED: uncharacterized protein LOC104882472 isoform X2 [Vitis vinifera]